MVRTHFDAQIGEAVRARRTALRMDERVLARLLHVSPVQLKQREEGQAPFGADELHQVRKAL